MQRGTIEREIFSFYFSPKHGVLIIGCVHMHMFNTANGFEGIDDDCCWRYNWQKVPLVSNKNALFNTLSSFVLVKGPPQHLPVSTVV